MKTEGSVQISYFIESVFPMHDHAKCNHYHKQNEQCVEYDGPTDSIVLVMAFRICGYKVPREVIDTASTRTRLQPCNRVSQGETLNPTWFLITGAHKSNCVNERPTVNNREVRMNTREEVTEPAL